MAGEAPQREGSVPVSLFASTARVDSWGNAPGVPHVSGRVPSKLLFDSRLRKRGGSREAGNGGASVRLSACCEQPCREEQEQQRSSHDAERSHARLLNAPAARQRAIAAGSMEGREDNCT